MNRIIKRILIGIVIIIAAFAIFLVLSFFNIFSKMSIEGDFEESNFNEELEAVITENEHIEFNEDNGMLYVDNEIVVISKTDAKIDDIRELAKKQGADIDETMADIGVYKFVYDNPMTYDELESKIKRIKQNASVEDAYYNIASIYESDDLDESDFEHRDPVYPSDDWGGDSWDTSVPGGKNWGMEAIDAPGAWGYLDKLDTVSVGLIDTMPNTAHADLSNMFLNSSCIFIDTNSGLVSTNSYTLPPSDHGTHVSGIMDAEWDNSVGVSGVMGGKGKLHYSSVYYDTNGDISGRYNTAYSYILSLKTLIDQDVQVINISQNTGRLIGFAASHGNENAINYLSKQADIIEKVLSRIIEIREAKEESDFIICVAAGNSNNTYYYKDDKAIYGYREKMTSFENIMHIFGWHGEKGDSLALYNNILNLMSSDTVKNRVVVVGSIGIDEKKSTGTMTLYRYSKFSNVGDRVDIVAPGEDIYSCISDGYDSKSGTSMSSPHVSGVAGLIFAANPDLSGPDVKNILLASTTGRYYYNGGYSGLVNANMAVINSLKTEKKSVKKVLGNASESGLDLCFVVDTTASMGDDIDNAKENMTEILEHLSEKTSDYRVSLIDYRDYPSRSINKNDYPYKVQLYFTNDNGNIKNAINKLDLGSGGDNKETVYSALMAAAGLDWRADSKKVIIILGDAAPLDPEPETGYTYEDVLHALLNSDISLDYKDSDKRVINSLDDSFINVYSIGTNADKDASDFFNEISDETGGSFSSVDDASKVGDAIIDSIEQIDIVKTVSVNADFGDSLPSKDIDIYKGNIYQFSIKTDDDGKFKIDSVEPDIYHWRCGELFIGGTIEITGDAQIVSAKTTQKYWFTPVLEKWKNNRFIISAITLVIIAFLSLIPLLFDKVLVLTMGIGGDRKNSKRVKIRYCPNCGGELPENVEFCARCGRKIDK